MRRLGLLGIGVTVGVAGIGLLVIILQMAEVDLPTWALILLGILAGQMILIGMVTMLIALVGASPLLTLWGFARRIRLRTPLALVSTRSVEPSGQKAPAVMFHPQTVRVSVSQVNISGLLAKLPSNESVSLVFNVANFSGFSIRVKGVRGNIAIGGERQEPPPSLVLPGDEPIEVPFQTTRPAELRQVTAGLRQHIYKGGMYGKNGITAFALSNVKLVCDVVIPDGSEKEQELRISDSSFVLRGPLREDIDYEAVNRQSLSFGSNNWYSADGPNEAWYQTQ